MPTETLGNGDLRFNYDDNSEATANSVVGDFTNDSYWKTLENHYKVIYYHGAVSYTGYMATNLNLHTEGKTLYNNSSPLISPIAGNEYNHIYIYYNENEYDDSAHSYMRHKFSSLTFDFR